VSASPVCTRTPRWREPYRDPDDSPSVNGCIVEAAVTDLDLAASTRTCLQYLYPLLVPGGSLFSHDWHLPLGQEAFNDDAFWRNVVGHDRPPIQGLGRSKLLRITKPVA